MISYHIFDTSGYWFFYNNPLKISFNNLLKIYYAVINTQLDLM